MTLTDDLEERSRTDNNNNKNAPLISPPKEEVIRFYAILPRPSQDVDVLVSVEIPCSRPETFGFYSRCLLTKHEDHRRKQGLP